MNKEFSRISIKLFRIFIFIFFTSSLLNACKKNEPDENQTVALPSNLEVTISLDSNNFGFVGIIASANNANFYTFRFVKMKLKILSNRITVRHHIPLKQQVYIQ